VAEENKDYEVGFGKPPKHTQFQPGQSGNPNGRPKRTKNAETLLDQILSKTIRITENGTPRTLTMAQAFIQSLVTDAVKGKADARRMVFAYMMAQKEVEGFEIDAADKKALDDFLKRVNQQDKE